MEILLPLMVSDSAWGVALPGGVARAAATTIRISTTEVASSRGVGDMGDLITVVGWVQQRPLPPNDTHEPRLEAEAQRTL